MQNNVIISLYVLFKHPWKLTQDITVPLLPKGDYFLWVLMLDISADWSKKCKFLYPIILAMHYRALEYYVNFVSFCV